ncbi:hypothetical protein OG760_00615 [Streptomyces sp. NBC_00963]|uniref:hypothetical protein n=1 Tax=Streptomyces sp. NBC_00963 TaxID=2903697 RepID=UPI003869B6F9|nr:hypothetical protein OG760_00615 [Streptomyces sp. NBC_00963]
MRLGRTHDSAPPTVRNAPRNRGRGWAAASLAVAVAALTALAPTASASSGFTVFTNERGADTPGLQQYGAVKATVVYDYYALTCDADGCYSNGGALPSEAAYESKVKEYMGASQFGGGATAPVVLDFENIVLTAESGQAATNALNLWKQLITWTHRAAPSAPVGMYGYDSSTTNNSLTQQLHQNGLLDFFAPRAYRGSSQTDAAWTSTLDAAVTNDHSLAPGQPIYPYISPSWDGSPGGAYMSGTTWGYTIDQLKAKTDGAVVWEPSANDASACNWVAQNAYEMGALTGTPSSGPLTATATPPSGNCTVPRGSTTTVPVTVTNTSGSTTAATQMQSFTGGSGFSGSWQYWNVPSLAPGASFRTSLPLAVASSQSTSTALLHIRTGLSDTRWAVVVK